MLDNAPSKELLEFIVDRANVGLFILNENFEIQLWNNFMASNSGVSSSAVLGKSLFDCFPELPERWFARKLKSVFMLKNYAFVSWEQRPYLFPFKHNRPVTGVTEFMCQDLTLMPIKNEQGEVEGVCVYLFDVTDTAIYKAMHKTAMEELEAVSRTDGLTQLFNRRHWQSRFDEEFGRSRRYKLPMTLLMFDLDHFKSVNDNYGHLAGDAILIKVSEIIRQNLRDSDIAGRYGGEEFVILLPNTDMEGSYVVAERLRSAIESATVEFEEQIIPFTSSFGLAQFQSQVTDGDQLIANADEALYQAKDQGRNRVVKFASA